MMKDTWGNRSERMNTFKGSLLYLSSSVFKFEIEISTRMSSSKSFHALTVTILNTHALFVVNSVFFHLEYTNVYMCVMHAMKMYARWIQLLQSSISINTTCWKITVSKQASSAQLLNTSEHKFH